MPLPHDKSWLDDHFKEPPKPAPPPKRKPWLRSLWWILQIVLLFIPIGGTVVYVLVVPRREESSPEPLRAAVPTQNPRPAAPDRAPRARAVDPLSPPDATARHLADNVNDLRTDRAGHLLWLDRCAQSGKRDVIVEHLKACGDHDRNAYHLQLMTLDADIDMHGREWKRVDALLDAAEQRLCDYCADHHQHLPPLLNPPTATASGRERPRPTLAEP